MENERVSGVDEARETESGVEYRTIDYDALKRSYYRGEGNTTLVLALPDEGKVLRLRKSDAKNENEAGRDGNDNGEARARLAVDFHRQVIATLLGRFATEPEIVRCNWKDLSARLNALEAERPASRRHKTVTETFATLLPDYAQLADNSLEIITSKVRGRNVCIEMKVKALTRHCGEPLHRKKWKAETACPSCHETFGGAKCLRNVLARLAHEAKSLRIFEDGRLFAQANKARHPGTRSIVELWSDRKEISTADNRRSMRDLIGEALERPFPATFSSASPERRERAPNGESVMDVIARIERDSRREVDTIYPIYAKYSSILTDRMVYIGDEKNETTTLAGMPSSDELRALRDYLVYRVVRDSSILVTYRTNDRREEDFSDETTFTVGETPRRPDSLTYTVNITDLEPKSVHCIEKHYRKYLEKRDKSGS